MTATDGQRERAAVVAFLRSVQRGRAEWLAKNLPGTPKERDGVHLVLEMIIVEIQKGSHTL